MLFQNRQDAGRQLAEKLEKYKNKKNTIVFGLPRGGVVCAAQMAKVLHLPLDVIVVRKMGAPDNPELAIGAIDENGEGPINEEIVSNLQISQEYIEEERERAKTEAQRRLHIFRGDKAPLKLKGKTIILVDDGLATGATMRAAIYSVRAKKSKKVIVAIPVGASESIEKIKPDADEIYCLYTPSLFGSVGNFYEDFTQTSDEEVIKILTTEWFTTEWFATERFKTE